MLNVREVVVGAFKAIGDIGDADTLDGNKTAIGLHLLNQVNSKFNLGNLFPFTQDRVIYAPLTSKREYTIGIPTVDYPTVDINADRPANIQRAYIKYASTDSAQSEIDIVSLEDLPMFEIEGASLPQCLAYQTQYPHGKIVLNCDMDLTYQLVLVYAKPLPVLQINDVATIPPEYEPSLMYALAYHLAIHYGKPREVVEDMKNLSEQFIRSIEENTIRKSPAVAHLDDNNGMRNRTILDAW